MEFTSIAPVTIVNSLAHGSDGRFVDFNIAITAKDGEINVFAPEKLFVPDGDKGTVILLGEKELSILIVD